MTTRLLLKLSFSLGCMLPGFLLQAQLKPLQIIVIGAHPDDADIDAGGTAALWASMGHNVKFLSLTNGDAGHQSMGGGALAKRRRAEAAESARRLGVKEYEVLENHDGELMPTLEVRKQVIRRIRQWNADVVILPRPNDYHPDHRNTGLVVQDAAYMVIVPNVVSDTPPLEKNPVFIYSADRFQKPTPFEPDIAVNIDPVFMLKVDGMDAHVSQFYEWLPWTSGSLDMVPGDKVERRQWLRDFRYSPLKDETRQLLEKWYDPTVAASVKHVETFEICEYGRQPDEATIRQLFPMLGTSSPSVTAFGTPEPLNIDGKLDEAVYQRSSRIYLRNSQDPQLPTPSAYESYAQLAYDDTYLYLAFHCNDPDIHSSFTQRDEHLWKEEAVEVFIDTDPSDPNRYVELQVSPRNVIYDSYIVDPQKIDVPKTARYNLEDFRTAVSVIGTLNQAGDIDQSWTVEMAIPWAEIVTDYEASQLAKANWRINFYRINVDEQQKLYQAWSPTQGSFHQPEKFGHVIFR